jgi:hypothetical protein
MRPSKHLPCRAQKNSTHLTAVRARVGVIQALRELDGFTACSPTIVVSSFKVSRTQNFFTTATHGTVSGVAKSTPSDPKTTP